MSNPKMSAVEKSLFDEMGPKIDGSSETMVNNTLSSHTIVDVSLLKSFLSYFLLLNQKCNKKNINIKISVGVFPTIITS